MHSLPHYHHSSPEQHIYYCRWTYMDTSLSPKIILYVSSLVIEFTLGIIYSISLDKCIMTYIYHNSTVQISFTVLKTLCALLIYPSLPLTLMTIDMFTVSTVLPLPDCYTVGIIHIIVGFWNWLFSPTQYYFLEISTGCCIFLHNKNFH